MFDRNNLTLISLSERIHDLTYKDIVDLTTKKVKNRAFYHVSQAIYEAHLKQSSSILMMGAHVIRSGVQRYIIDLMKRGFLSCIAMNGAGLIHDYEFALIGKTTENVSLYIKNGQFGLWKETGRINDIVTEAAKRDKGLGEYVGEIIEKEGFPFKDISILAAGYRLKIPVTVHVSIGCDIVHEHPNCNGAAYGKTSYTDFLKFTHVLQNIENGVVMNFGSAVMAPEVYLKALSMVRNVAHQEQRSVKQFVTLVCDLHNIPENFYEEPSRTKALYFFRPWKTMLVRTVIDGGKSYYVKGNHDETIPELWSAINEHIYKQKESG